MGHFIGIEEKSFYVEDDGRVYDSPEKNHEYEKVGDDYKPIIEIEGEEVKKSQAEKGKLDAEAVEQHAPASELPEISELMELMEIRREELEGIKWPALRSLHKSVTGSDERNLKKPEIIEGILRQEFS